MTRRERVISALNHKEPDKVPVDCGAMRSTGIMGVAYNRLKKHLGIEGGGTKIHDMIQQLCIPEPWYLDMFQVDVVDLARTFADNPTEWRDWTLPDGSSAKIPAWLRIERSGDSWVCVNQEDEAIAEMPESSYFFDQAIWPLYGMHKEDFDDLSYHMNRVMWSYMADPLWKNSKDPNFYTMLSRNFLGNIP